VNRAFLAVDTTDKPATPTAPTNSSPPSNRHTAADEATVRLAAGPVDSHPDIEVFFSASRPLPRATIYKRSAELIAASVPLPQALPLSRVALYSATT
jgi:hypothetical protein